MALPSEYLDELNVLNKKIREEQPTNIIQFCAEYFNKRVQEERYVALQHNNNNSKPPFANFNTSSFSGCDPHGEELSKLNHKKDSPRSSQDPNFKAQLNENTNDNNNNDNHLGQAHQQNFPMNFNANRRTSVSAETITPNMINSSLVEPPKESQLTKDQLKRLNDSVCQNFLFKNLDEEALHLVLHSLSEKHVEKNGVIIQEGDEGDYFYIIESGSVEYSKGGEKLSQSGPGGSFGELALMYNAPRAASVTALEDCTLWALDRLTFRKILLHKTAHKRAMYEEFLKEVPVLRVLDQYQLSKLADALRSETFQPGQDLIVEGDVGEEFYLIEYGTAQVSRADKGVVAELKKGDYFGEVALLNDQPRAATVTATSKLKVVALGKSAFQRLLGKAVDILKRQDPTQSTTAQQQQHAAYQHQHKQVSG